MKPFVSPYTRTLLAQSLRPVETNQDAIRNALSASLTRSERDPELSDTPDIVAALLLSFLVEQVRHVVEDGQPSNLELHRTEHRLHDVDGRHYSRFGDVLVPILRDILGPTFPRAIATAWSDAFWAIVRQMRHEVSTAPRLAELAA